MKIAEENRYNFRGKMSSREEWIYGYYYEVPVSLACYKEQENRRGIMIIPRQMIQTDVICETVGLYTGKRDISGKKIYEGDIIESHLCGKILYPNMEIKYGVYQAYCPVDDCNMDSVGFYVRQSGLPDMPLGPTEDYAKIIGNIFDNPELLEK